VREILAATMQKYYEIEEAITDEGWPEEQAQEAIKEWLQLLGTSTGPLRAMALEELKAKLSSESQQAVNQSQRQAHSLKRPHDCLEEPAPGDEQDDEVRDKIDDINWDLEFIDDAGAL
jgi:hypothetical protein